MQFDDSYTIKSLAKRLGVTDMIVIRKMRKLGIKGHTPKGRIFFTEEEAKQLLSR